MRPPIGATTKNAEGKELAEMYDASTVAAQLTAMKKHPVICFGRYVKSLHRSM